MTLVYMHVFCMSLLLFICYSTSLRYCHLLKTYIMGYQLRLCFLNDHLKFAAWFSAFNELTNV